MIPYLLAIAGGYLIAQSRKQDTFAYGGTMDEGGLMKDFDKNFTTAYILQQQMADKQKVQGVAHDSYDTTYYNEKYYPIRYHDGHSFASKELYNDLRDGSGNIKGSDEREVEEKITAYFDESDVKKLSGSTLHDMWKNGEGISVEKKKKKWFFDDGGNISEYADGGTIEEALERFDVTKLDAFEKMQYDNFSKSVGKQQALQVLINSVEGDYSELSPHLRAIAEKFKMAKGGKFEYKSTEVKSRVQVGGFYIYSDYNDNPYETNPDRKFIAYIPAFAEDGYFPYSAYPTRAEAVENAREYYQADFDAGKFEPTEDYVKRLKKKSGNTMKSGGKVKKYKYYIEFLNKKKGFSRDKKVFDTEEEAVRWGRKNLERFNYDMLKIEFY